MGIYEKLNGMDLTEDRKFERNIYTFQLHVVQDNMHIHLDVKM